MPHGDRDQFNLQEAFEFARATIQMLFAINGGAAVAIIAFYGQAWATMPLPERHSLAGALMWFVGGVVAATLTGFTGYLSQKAWGSNFKTAAKSDRSEASAPWVELAAVTMAIGSLVLFVIGCLQARSAIVG